MMFVGSWQQQLAVFVRKEETGVQGKCMIDDNSLTKRVHEGQPTFWSSKVGCRFILATKFAALDLY